MIVKPIEFYEGRAACKADDYSPPYEVGTKEAEAWETGWMDAADEAVAKILAMSDAEIIAMARRMA